MRAGEAAIEHAKKACELTEWKEGELRRHARGGLIPSEAGDFELALMWQEEAVALASSGEATRRLYRPRGAISSRQAVPGRAEVIGLSVR